MVKVKEDLTGRTFGNLTVIQQTEDYISIKGQRHAQWLCKCSCGNPNTSVLKVRGSSLKNGHTKSCGHCGNGYKELDLNLVDDNGLYGIGYCSNTGTPFYFDMEDFEIIRWLTWYEHVDGTGYHTLKAKQNGNHVKMSHLLGYKNYDHIDRNPLNNRRCNFRKATYTDNAQNKSLQKNNTSNVTGVALDKKYNCWTARIQVNGERKYLGCFTKKEDAIKARLKAEIEYYGEFAPQQHLYEKYGVAIQN